MSFSGAKHGDYNPSMGWYSANTGQWHRDPAKIGIYEERREPTEYERQEFANSDWGRNGRKAFKPVADLDRLIQLRDSDRPDDRAKAEKLMTASRRMQVHDYEAAKTAAETDGAA